MADHTVTIGDTEVAIEETDDGFEATPVEEDDRRWLKVEGRDTVYVPSDDGILVHSEGCRSGHTRICVLGDELVLGDGRSGWESEHHTVLPHDTYDKEFGWWVGTDASTEIVEASDVPSRT